MTHGHFTADGSSRSGAARSAPPRRARSCRRRCRRRSPRSRGERPGAGLDDIEHVVILMQENRSFDHYFGCPARRARLRRPQRDRAPLRQAACSSSRAPWARTVLPFPVRRGRRDPEEGPPVHRRARPLLGRRRQGLGRRLDGRLDHRQDRRDHGVLRPRRHPAALRTRRHLHRLRRLPLLHPLLHQPQPQPPRGAAGRATRRTASGPSATTRTTRAPTPATTGARTPSGWRRPGASWQTYTEWENFTDNQIEFFTTFKAVARRPWPRRAATPTWSAFYAKPCATPTTRPSATRLLGAAGGGRRRADPRRAQPLRAGAAAGGDRARSPTSSPRTWPPATLPEVSYLVPSAVDSEHPSVSSPVAQRDHRLQGAGRARHAPRRLAAHRRPHQLRRERRLLRPRAAARARPRRGRPRSAGRAGRPGSACGCRCSSSRRGPSAATSAPRSSTTPP